MQIYGCASVKLKEQSQFFISVIRSQKQARQWLVRLTHNPVLSVIVSAAQSHTVLCVCVSLHWLMNEASCCQLPWLVLGGPTDLMAAHQQQYQTKREDVIRGVIFVHRG